MTRTIRTASAVASLALSLVGRPASADDTWATPFPGIRHLHRTAPGVNIHAAVVDLCAPGVSVRHTAFEERRQRPSAFATSVGAQWAINADFSCRPVDVRPGGPFPPCEGFPEYMTYGIAAHAGVPWPAPPFHDAVLAFAPGRVELYPYEAHQEYEPWMQEVLSGHFGMVENGALTVYCRDVGAASRNPATVIGLSRDRTQLIMAVRDGRGSWTSPTCDQMGNLLIELGAWSGFNLDGGGSSAMWSQASGVLNHPSDGSERVVGPHLAIYASGSGPSPFCDRAVVDPTAPLPALATSGPRGRLSSVPAARLFDTRTASTRAGLEGLSLDASGRVAAASTFSFAGLGAHGVPMGSAAAVTRVTLTDQTGPGFATVFPAGLPTPGTSTVNFTTATDATNLALGGLGTSGSFAVTVSTPSHVVADLDGYFGLTGSGFVPETPRRLLDTRGSPPLAPGVERDLGISSPAGTTALALDVVTLGASAAGSVSIHPCGEDRSTGSVVPVGALAVVSTGLLARSGPAGLCATAADVEVHLVVDTTGGFTPTGGLDYQPLVPTRLVDSRTPGGIWFGRTESDTTVEIDLSRAPGYPADAEAVALNVTSVSASSGGFVSLYPCAAARPDASSLNYAAGAVVGNSVIVGTGGGVLCVYVSARTHLVIDIVGVFVPPLAPLAPDAGVPSGADATVGSRTDVGVPDRTDAGTGRPSGGGGCGCVIATSGGGARARTAAWVALGLGVVSLARRRRRAQSRVDAPCVDATRQQSARGRREGHPNKVRGIGAESGCSSAGERCPGSAEGAA